MLDKGFPDKIKGYKIKWYIGPGNFGSMLSETVAYMAISVDNTKAGTFLLFVSKTFKVLSVVECEDEGDAFDTVEIPDDALWIRIEKSKQQKRYNRMYLWRSILNKLNSIKVEMMFVVVILFIISCWLPSYGKCALWFRLLQIVSAFGMNCVCLSFVIVACRNCRKDRLFEFVSVRVIVFILSLMIIFLGKNLVLCGVDFYIGTQDIYLTSTSYQKEYVRRGLDHYYLSGECEGQFYSVNVTGCNHSLLYDIEDMHPMVKVTLYENTKTVVKLEIIDEKE